MGNLIVIMTTLTVILVLIARCIRNNTKIKTSILSLLTDINTSYTDLFTEKGLIVRLTQGGMVLSADFLALALITTAVSRYFKSFLPISIEWLVKLILILISFVIIHYSIGYVLLVSSKIHRFIYKVNDKNLKVDFILSYFITSTFLTVLFLFPGQLETNIFTGLIGVIICYYLNIKILLTLIVNPMYVTSDQEDVPSFTRIIIAAILILIMLVITLFLLVCFINALGNGAYTNVNGHFDLFYYTIITFTTIGYGDIVPITVAAKLVAVLISITSVICITVFLSSILSSKDKISNLIDK